MKYTILIAIIAISFAGCVKSPSITETSLSIVIKDYSTSARIPGATVTLYSSQTAMETSSSPLDTKITDADGVAKFDGLATLPYYWKATIGCKSNLFLENGTGISLTKNKINVVNGTVQSMGTLTFNNTSTNPYKIFVNDGVVINSLAGNTAQTIPYPIGNVTVRVLQLSGYVVYPTDKSYTGNLTCGGALQTTFP